MIVSCPWPHRDLHPNARVHHFAKAKRVRAYRQPDMFIPRPAAPQQEAMDL